MFTPSQLLTKAATTSPQQWIKALLNRLKRKQITRNKPRPGTPQILDTNYFAHRNPLIQNTIRRIEAGEELETVLLGFDGTRLDERIVEYPALASWIMNGDDAGDLLDIGCVLNNKLIASFLMRHCERLWFVNPAFEPIDSFNNRVFYHLNPLSSAFSKGETFPRVTCISTIEHIGFDNSHYGVNTPAEFGAPSDTPLLDSFNKIATLVSATGRCFITVPFGRRELVTHPLTGRFSSQVFDYESMKKGLDTLLTSGITPKLSVFSAESNGWIRVEPDSYVGRYAHGVPAASAVAIITGIRG